MVLAHVLEDNGAVSVILATFVLIGPFDVHVRTSDVFHGGVTVSVTSLVVTTAVVVLRIEHSRKEKKENPLSQIQQQSFFQSTFLYQ